MARIAVLYISVRIQHAEKIVQYLLFYGMESVYLSSRLIYAEALAGV